MFKMPCKCLFLLWFVLTIQGCASSYFSKLLQIKMSDRRPVAFVNVNVVTMNNNRILREQTVTIQNEKIRQIGNKTKVVAPKNSLIIDGTEKYLIPGLADMHVHINSDKDLILFLVHGVTTIQNMWGYNGLVLKGMGFPDQLQLRNEINEGVRLGPTIYTSGPILEGDPLSQPFMKKIDTPEIGSIEVISQKSDGYDFVKVYDHLDKETYYLILQTADMEHQSPSSPLRSFQ